MRVIVCLDDNGGMMYNSRRQSRDRVLIDDVCAEVGGARLLVDAYSLPLFEGRDIRILESADMPSEAANGDFCFVENISVSSFGNRLDELIIYRWNRVYPRDFTFDFDLEKYGLELCNFSEFAGYSHEKITKEIYRK